MVKNPSRNVKYLVDRFSLNDWPDSRDECIFLYYHFDAPTFTCIACMQYFDVSSFLCIVSNMHMHYFDARYRSYKDQHFGFNRASYISKCSYLLCQALGAMRIILPPFPKVERLKLNTCIEECKQIVQLLEIFPQLKTLVLQHKKAKKHFHCKESFEFEANLPNSFLQELRIITITCAEVEDSIFPLIEILLKHASKLEKMVFRVKETPSPSNSSFLKMIKMTRSSPNAELVFL